MSLDYIDVFVQGKSIRTQRTWRSLAKKFAKFLQERDLTLTTVQPIHVREFIYEQDCMNTRNTYKIFFKAFFKTIGRKDLVDDLKQGLRDIRVEGKFAVDLNLNDIMKTIEVTAQPEYKFAWSLMAFDGFRPGEVLGLYFEDIDLENMKVCLKKREEEKYGPKMKKPSQKPDWIPLNPLSASLFKQIPKGSKRIVAVSYNTLRKWWDRAVKQLNIRKAYPITMHKLRHFFGHHWDRKKGSMRILKEIMRHSKLEYTMIYTQPSEAEIREEFERVIG